MIHRLQVTLVVYDGCDCDGYLFECVVVGGLVLAGRLLRVPHGVNLDSVVEGWRHPLSIFVDTPLRHVSPAVKDLLLLLILIAVYRVALPISTRRKDVAVIRMLLLLLRRIL